MIHTMRSEWIKLSTVRVHRVLVLVAAALALVITVLVTALIPSGDLFGPTGFVEFVSGSTLISIVLLATVVILGFTGEHGSGTIRATYTATPQRVRVIVAKVLVSAVAIGAATVVLVALVWAIGAGILSSRGGSVGLSLDDGTVTSLVAIVGLAIAFGWFGFGFGVIVRNSPAAVTLFLLWPLLIENLLAGVLFVSGQGGLVKWLPYQAALSTTLVDSDSGSDQLGRPWGLVWFASVSLVLIAVGTLAERRRDA